MESPYSWIYESGYVSCDYIGDFVTSPLVKRAFWDVWNEACMPDEELDNTKDFDIYNPKHLWFIRDVATIDELWVHFLQALRRRAIQLKNINKLKYDYKQITSFILLWNNIQFRLRVTPESFRSLFSEKISDLVINLWKNTAFRIWDYETSMFNWLNKLVSQWFSPIDENGNIVFALEEAVEFYGFFKVVNKKWKTYFINKTGKILQGSEFEVERLRWMKEQIEFYKECIWLLRGIAPQKYPTKRITMEIDSFQLKPSWDKGQDVIRVIDRFESMIQGLSQEVRKAEVREWRTHLKVVN